MLKTFPAVRQKNKPGPTLPCIKQTDDPQCRQGLCPTALLFSCIMPALKHIISFLMLMAMLFTGSRYLVFRSVVNMQKKEFRQQILQQEHKTIKQLSVNPGELYRDGKGLEWKENNKELVINDVYHEVLSVKRCGDLFIVSIIEDTEENELFKKYFHKAGHKKDIAAYLLFLFGVNFIASPILAVEPRAAVAMTYPVQHSSDSGTEVYNRSEKPPRA